MQWFLSQKNMHLRVHLEKSEDIYVSATVRSYWVKSAGLTKQVRGTMKNPRPHGKASLKGIKCFDVNSTWVRNS